MFTKGWCCMVTALTVAILVALMASAFGLYNVLDGMLSKVEGKVRPHVPVVKQKVTAGLEAATGYVRPRAAGWARRLALGCVAHAAVFFGAATVLALVKPAPTTVTYQSIAKRPDSSWLQHGLAYVGYGSGWFVEETRPGFFYSTATLNDGSTLIGLPGLQQWFRL